MLSDWRIRLRSLLRRTTAERDLDDEVRFHLERETEKLVAAGVSPQEALRRARLRFGGAEQIKEDCRDARGVRVADEILRDLRHGARALAGRPGFTLVVVLTLALGIGANTAIFSLIDALLLRSLPVPHPEQLVTVESGSDTDTPWTYPIWDQIRQRPQLFAKAMA